MAWETRQRGGLYYTRSRRENGRVVREYVGGGIVGELAAAMDAERRAQREAQRQTWEAEQERLAALEAPLVALNAACRDLTRRYLEDAGFHQHKGQWRRKRRGRKGER